MPRRKPRRPRLNADDEPVPERRWFGEYKCTDCNRYWASAWCWDGFGQKCRVCNIEVMPFRKRPLRRRKEKPSNTKDDKKRHMSELCGKCTSVGRCNN